MQRDVEGALDSVHAGQAAHELEGPTLDFKVVGRSLSDSLRNVAEAAVCFANSQGGSIVVGVADRPGGPDAFVGSELDPIRLVARIYELTDPSLVVLAENTEVHGANLTIITVPSSPDVHQVGGRATERIGDRCEPMSASRITSVLADRRGDDWSAKDSGAALETQSPSAEEYARELLASAAEVERQSWARLPWADLCRRLGVAAGDNLTNAGALLFTESGRAHFQYVRRAANSGLLSANEAVRGTGLIAVRRALELIETRTERTALLTPTGQQLLLGDLPEAAVREAVVNAFMHRDYRNAAHVQLEHSEGRLRVTSPGGFVPGVTVSNVLTVSSRCRNLALAQAVRALGLAESAGVGVDRMYAAMTAVGHAPPTFSTDGTTVETTLEGGPPNEPVARFVAGLPEGRRGDPDTLLVLTYLLRHRTTNARRMHTLMQKGEKETEERLLALSAPGDALIERTAETARSARGEYRLVGEAVRALGAAVTYRARSGDDSDRKIITLVRELGTINGRVVQTMFDVQPATASRILSDLVDRQILTKTSKATRGPAVTYGPGAKFPPGRSTTAQKGQDGGDDLTQDMLHLELPGSDREH